MAELLHGVAGTPTVAQAETEESPVLLVQSAPLLGGDPAWPGAERKVAAGDLVDLRDVDTEPVAVSRPAPSYPDAARRMRRDGTVNLRLLVDESGSVTMVEPAGDSAATEFLAAAQRAARKWTYEPARKDGVPVKVWIPVRVVFKP